MKLDVVQTFLEVVRAGGFTAAARRSGMPRSTVSLHIAALERSLGARLLKRSTRSIALTAEGRALFARADGAMTELFGALDDARTKVGFLSGPIRLTAPADLPIETLAEAVGSFASLHPEVRFEIRQTNETLDLVAENIDIAIRVGATRAMDAVERPLTEFDWGFFASTEWVERHGEPKAIETVDGFVSPTPSLRRYLEAEVLAEVSLPHATIVADGALMVRQLMQNGQGVALLPTGLCEQLTKDGEALRVLAEVKTMPTCLRLVFPTRADMIPRVKSFADHLVDAFRTVPEE